MQHKLSFFVSILPLLVTVAYAGEFVCPCETESLNKCASRCNVEPTCDVPKPKTFDGCLDACLVRCECNPGYIRRETGGPCVPINECPQYKYCTCENEILNTCGPSCTPEPTCNNMNPKPTSEACITLCVPRCECKDGYIRREAGGPCVPITECPAKCRKNEEIVCLSCCGQPTCAKRFCNKPCPKICILGCGCKPGFILNEEGGKCIPIEQCPEPDC